MNITKCGYCGIEISTKTDTCPGCGEKIRISAGDFKGLFRRIIFFVMAVYIIYSAVKFFIENNLISKAR